MLFTHGLMRAESNQIVSGRGAGPDFLLQKLEHQRHRHGARTVGNDDQYPLVLYTEHGRDFGDELLDLVTRKFSPRSAFAENCHSSFEFTKHLLFRLAIPSIKRKFRLELQVSRRICNA